MFVSDSLNVNKEGHLTIGGADTLDLAKNFGTPLIVYSEDGIRKNFKFFNSSIQEYYGGNGRVLYASKAFCCKEMCRIAESENAGLDVVSGGEIYTALSVGFPEDRLYFHGNNKTYNELEYAVKSGVGRIIADNIEEIKTLESLAEKYGKKIDVYLRVKPGIDAHTHKFIRTGQIDSKFGFALETGEAMDAVRECTKSKKLNLCGMHCHIGSQIFDPSPFVLAAEVMMKFLSDIQRETGITITELDLGGGFGIKYTENDKPVRLDGYMRPVSEQIKKSAEKYSLPVPYILLEPGRSIAAAEAVTLYTVGAVKKIPNIRNYVSIDGGMTDNPRYILYQAEYTVLNAGKADALPDTTVTVAGKCCETGDLIQENAKIKEVKAGDILAVLTTGAYCYSMASNYNRVERPEVVFVTDGIPRTVIRRETYEQMAQNDI